MVHTIIGNITSRQSLTLRSLLKVKRNFEFYLEIRIPESGRSAQVQCKVSIISNDLGSHVRDLKSCENADFIFQ